MEVDCAEKDEWKAVLLFQGEYIPGSYDSEAEGICICTYTCLNLYIFIYNYKPKLNTT